MDMQFIESRIASSRPRRGIMRGSMLVLLALSMLLGALWADPGTVAWKGTAGWVLPQVVLITMLGLMAWTSLRQRRLARLMQEGFESVQLRQWDRARTSLSELLRHPLRPAGARAESLLALGAVAEAEQDYIAAQRLYETVLEENLADAMQLYSARVALAAMMLRTGQLTDAVRLIEKLERASLAPALKTQVELVSLLREVSMGQWEASLERADERREAFRQHLGTSAAYGYALLAVALDRAGRSDAAARSWRDATLLIRPADLLRKVPEVEVIADKYPAATFVL